MSDMTVEKAQALLEGNKFRSDSEGYTIYLLASAYITQAAELARLSAKVEAADKLAAAAKRADRALKPFSDRVFNDNGDYTISDLHNLTAADCANAYQARGQINAALSAYEGAKE